MEQSEKQDSFILEVISDMRELEKTDNINPIDNLMFLLMIKLKHLNNCHSQQMGCFIWPIWRYCNRSWIRYTRYICTNCNLLKSCV